MASDLNATDKMLEEFAVDDTGAFGRIRNTLRATGDMFLFGKPTPDILHIMIKLYHENIVKNLSFMDREYISSTIRDKILPGRKINNLQFMCGIIEMNDGQFYITISEAPKINKRIEDKLFEQKEKILDKLLKSCNIKVDYPERKNSNKTISDMAVTTFGTLSSEEYKIGWRSPSDKAKDKFVEGVLNPTIYDKDFKPFKLSTHLIINQPNEGSKSMNYNSDLWNKQYKVNMINSYKYLRQRITQGKSFAPFKKYKFDEPSADIECNNGSTCTESKLFSYVYNDLKMKFEDIKGFSVFWVGKELPPTHHIKGYCYSPSIEAENTKLEKLRDDCLRILDTGTRTSYMADSRFSDVLKHVVQPIAMACPGCYSNYLKYTKGNMGTKWDQEGCYLEVSPRTARAKQRETQRLEIAAAAAANASKKKGLTAESATVVKDKTLEAVKEAATGPNTARLEDDKFGDTDNETIKAEREILERVAKKAAKEAAEIGALPWMASIKGKHKGGNRTHKRKNQKRRNTRRLKHHRHT